MKTTFKEIASALNFGSDKRSQIISAPNNIVEILLTDSRSVRNPGKSLFFAISTPGGDDGHRYIGELYEKGVRNFIVSSLPEFLADKNDVNIIFVDDTVSALQKIARFFHCEGVEYVAVAGSKGKTTVKEYIFQLMSPLRKISRSPRSYNSQIGVPISLWEVDPQSDIALIEAGISRKSEMKRLRECVLPDTVIFTNIDEELADDFSSLQEKADEKVIIAAADSVKTVIYNGDSKILKNAVTKLGEEKKFIEWSFVDKSATLYLEPVKNGEEVTRLAFTYNGRSDELDVPAGNDADIENYAATLAFMLHENVGFDIIRERFGTLRKFGTRLNVTEGVNGCTLVSDSYINDVTTLGPAIDFMLRRKTLKQRSVIIMGEIVSDSNDKEKNYEETAEIIARSGIDRFIGIGEDFKRFGNKFAGNVEFYTDAKEFLQADSPSDFVNEIILLRIPDRDVFHRVEEMLAARTHETVLEVNLDSIVSNYKYFKSKVPHETGVVAMVKASGYGAGSYEIAKTLQGCGAACLAVAVVDEGVELRKNGITMPIMVMNPKVVDYGSLFSNRLEPEIYSMSMLREIINEARKRKVEKYPVHLKLDTGMHRMGFIETELTELVDILKASKEVRVGSVFSHLATADCPDMDDYTFLQFNLFKTMTKSLTEGLGYNFKRHILNSAGILRFPQYHYDMVRLGIGLYGVNTLPEPYEKPLAVVSSLRTIIIAVRQWEKGETIGYGRKGKLQRNSIIATVPIGYADGINRRFGNGNLKVMVNGREVPTIGNICMDAMMLDVTDIECKEGDSVEIFGPNMPVSKMAEVLETIPYEILTSVSPRVRRVYFRE